VGLYRHPPARGHIVCFDEMGPLQTIPRGGKAWASKAVRRPDRYRRAGTLQWFGAFCPTTGPKTASPSWSSTCLLSGPKARSIWFWTI